MSTSTIVDKKLYIWLHIIAWGILLVLPLYFFFTNTVLDISFFISVYVKSISFMLIFYLNYIWLVPLLFLKDKKLWYYISAAAIIVIFCFATEYIHSHFISHFQHDKIIEEFFDKLIRENRIPRPMLRMPIFNYLITSILVTGFSLGLSLANKFAQNEKKQKEMEKERLHSELAFLKNQISPHFFFNTLNNIYSLIQIDTGDAQKSVLKLSKLMRYLLYESESGKTSLGKEIEFMENYIDLMRLRINDSVSIKTSFPENNLHQSIQPLLFITFVENAFKHGISNRGASFIFISMEASLKELRFSCVNSFVQKSEESLESGSGIGLENIKKRLLLLYPDTHTLTINQTESSFEVCLVIHLTSQTAITE